MPGKPQQGVVPARADQWPVQVPQAAGRWVLALDVPRRGPTAGTPTRVAIRRSAAARAGQAPGAGRPVVAPDSAHDVAQLARAHLDAELVVRLAKHRVFRRAPGPSPGRGRPHTHGPRFELQDPRTHGRPDRSARPEHPIEGTVRVDARTTLHVEDAADAEVALSVPVSVTGVAAVTRPGLALELAEGKAGGDGEARGH